MESLPAGVCIIDIDNPSFTTPIKDWLASNSNLCIEETPSGGLHIWGKGIREDASKDGLCIAGLRLEYFLRGLSKGSIGL